MTPIVDPALANPETVLGALDFAGVAVFAATGGALTAGAAATVPAVLQRRLPMSALLSEEI